MAILKHIASKSSDYGAALEYLIFKHDELRKTPILDQNGNRIMRDEYYLDGLNCEPYSFDAACQQLNREYQKNKNKNEIKSHHYIISFDPRDSAENCLTGKRAQELGLEYAKANFPGHQALVCTHMDGHNGSGNIHVHGVMSNVRFDELELMLMAMFEQPTLKDTIQVLTEVQPLVAEDAEIAALVQQTIPKMQQLNEQQFKGLELEWYRPEDDAGK